MEYELTEKEIQEKDEHKLSQDEINEKEALRAQIQSYFREGTIYDTYIIPAGTELFSGYRGKLEQYKFETAISQPKFFGFNATTAEKYGYVFAYITTQPYELIAMDSLKTLEYLYGIAHNDEEIQKVLRRKYGYKEKRDEKFVQTRVSDKLPDFKLVQYLCDNDFSGYAINFMASDLGGTFHPECAICTPIGVKLNPIYQSNGMLGLVTPDSDAMQRDVNGLILKDRQIKNTEKYAKTKKKSILDSYSQVGTPPRIGLLSFDDNSPIGQGSPQAGTPPRIGLLSFDDNSPIGQGSPQAETPPRIGLLSFDDNSPIGQGSPQAGTPPRIGFSRRGYQFNSPNKKYKKGGKTRKQKRNASKKGIKSLRNKSYNNVRRRKVSNRRN